MKGRSDKMYCDISCKNAYNYKKQTEGMAVVMMVDKILHRNYSIMERIFADDKRKYFKMPKLALTKMGFDFNYYTGTYINSKGKTYHYIYDYAWMEFSNQEIMVVKGKGSIKP